MNRRALRLLWRDPVVLVAVVVGLALIVLTIVVPIVGGNTGTASNLSHRLQGPSWAGGDGGLFGTDELGRDLWTRSFLGLRTSFTVGILAVLLGAAIGTFVGLIAGYCGGWVDATLMRLTDVQLSVPGLLLVIAITGALGGGVRLLVVVLGLYSWPLYARVLRGAVLSLRRTDMVMATASLGASMPRILSRHVLPNTLATQVAVATLEFARLVLAEASLSFLGFGVQPPQVSLGAILSSGREYIQSEWWISTFAGILIALAVLCTNLIGSWLQRVTDPLRGAEYR